MDIEIWFRKVDLIFKVEKSMIKGNSYYLFIGNDRVLIDFFLFDEEWVENFNYRIVFDSLKV